MQIPTIFSLTINQSELDDAMRIGFCYVRLPSEALIQKIDVCMQTARNFFGGSPEEKAKWRLKETLLPGERYEGYVVRSQSKNTNTVEQIFFEPDSPFGPYVPHASSIQAIDDAFLNMISLPLLHTVFMKAGLSQDDYADAAGNPACSLVFQCCPLTGEEKNKIRLNAHKDFGLITVLYFEEDGLEVNYQNQWIPIPHKPGHLVINFGNALELMTNGCCHSALHRVTNATDNRVSMVYFVSPSPQRPVRNYINNKIIAETGQLF